MAGQTRIFGSGIPKDSEEEAAYAEKVRAGEAEEEPSRDEALSQTVEEFRAEALAAFSGFVFGDPFGLVVAVKGNPAPAPAPAEGRGFLEAPDGVALGKALDSLGYPADSLFGIQLDAQDASPGSRPVTQANLRAVIELVDPVSIVALDSRASQAVTQVFGAQLPEPGSLPASVRLMGRTAVLLDDFEASLQSQDAKRRSWAALKALGR